MSAYSNEEGNVSHRLGICRAEHVAFETVGSAGGEYKVNGVLDSTRNK